MEKRISITPGAQLRLVSSRWQAKFASESAEILIREGRYSEVLQTISGLTLADFAGEFLALKETVKNKRKRSKKEENVNIIDGSNNQTTQVNDIPLEVNSLQSPTYLNSLGAEMEVEKTNDSAEIQDDLF